MRKSIVCTDNMDLIRRQPARKVAGVESIVNEPNISKKWNMLASIKDPELQFQLAQHPHWEVRNSLARFNKQLTPEVQQILASDNHPYVRSNIAKHTTIPEVQSILAKDRELGVRLSLSGNEHLTKEVQILLAQDQSRDIRQALALQGNNLNGQVIQMLLKDKSPYVRWTLAHTNKSTDPELFQALVRDRSSKVRIRVVERLRDLDQKSAEVMHTVLEKDSDPEVKEALKREDLDRRTMAELPGVMKQLRRNAYMDAVMRII